MAKKFARTLMLIILLDSLHFVCFSQSNKEQFTLQLFMIKTPYILVNACHSRFVFQPTVGCQEGWSWI